MAMDDELIADLGRISLDEEERKLPAWQQMINNRALDPHCITKSNVCDKASQKALNKEEAHHSSNACKNKELRPYQKELVENALQGQNTIIYAPTGCGKTIMALHIIREHLKKSKDAKVAFLAKTVPLVLQQYKLFAENLPEYEVTNITGQSENSMKLGSVLSLFDVVVMTPMILVNHIKMKCLSGVEVFSLLVFDECHHTHGKDPYMLVMNYYLKTKMNNSCKLPQVIGLTASVGIEKAKDEEEAKKSILNICANLDAKYISSVEKNKENLQQFVPVPDEKLVELQYGMNDDYLSKMTKIMQEHEKQAQKYARELGLNEKVKNIPNDRRSSKYMQWVISVKDTAMIAPLFGENKQMKKLARLLMIISDYLKHYSIALEIYELVDQKSMVVYLESCFKSLATNEENTEEECTYYGYFKELQTLAKTQNRESPNLTTLTQTLKYYLCTKEEDCLCTKEEDYLCTKEKSSRGIIFVKTRAMAESLTGWLKNSKISAIAELKAAVFISANVGRGFGGMSQAEQEATMRDFREGNVRLLVATSIAEEGLDIPECNLVIRYNYVGNEISTVQIRGRSRAQNGTSVLMAPKNMIVTETENLKKIRLMEEAIRRIRQMETSKFDKYVQEEQRKSVKESEFAEKQEMQEKRVLQDVPFSLICALCKQVEVESSNIRLVHDSCRISVDRDLLNHIKIIPNKEVEYYNDLQFEGDVLCMGLVENTEKYCKQKLGSLIRHARNPFIAFKVNSFVLKTSKASRLDHIKQWKNVPYVIKEMDIDDLERYTERQHKTNNSCESMKEDHADVKKRNEETQGGSQIKRQKLESSGSSSSTQNSEVVESPLNAQRSTVHNKEATDGDGEKMDDVIDEIDEILKEQQ